MKVNPVTGKMEKIDPAEAAASGKHRDGSLQVDDRYINAAKELGLGGAEGEQMRHQRRLCCGMHVQWQA